MKSVIFPIILSIIAAVAAEHIPSRKLSSSSGWESSSSSWSSSGKSGKSGWSSSSHSSSWSSSGKSGKSGGWGSSSSWSSSGKSGKSGSSGSSWSSSGKSGKGMLAFAAAQDEPKCNCSPVGYTFELKLDAYTCPDPENSITPDDAVAYFGPGVKAYTCNPDSPIPVTITQAQFIVSDETKNPVLTQTKDSLELTDGETLTFTSVTTNPPLVGFILLKLVGKDINGVEIESRWTIQFTNECGVLSLEDGTEFSLVIFRDLERPLKTLCPREDPPPPPDGSYSYLRAFSKAGKGSKHTRHSSSKSGKNLNSKYDGYGGKSSKSKSGKSKDSRRILQTATSANAEHTSLPPMILKDQSVEKGGHEGLPLRRRRLHG